MRRKPQVHSDTWTKRFYIAGTIFYAGMIAKELVSVLGGNLPSLPELYSSLSLEQVLLAVNAFLLARGQRSSPTT